MSFVAAKCTQCGSSIEVDNSKDADVCSHCGTAFITQKAITNYNTYVQNNIQNATVNITGKNLDALRSLADELFSNEDYNSAVKYYTEIIESDHLDYRSKFLFYLCKSYGVTIDETENVSRTIGALPVFITSTINDNRLSSLEKSTQLLDVINRICVQIVAVHNLANSVNMVNLPTMDNWVNFKYYVVHCVGQLIIVIEEGLKYKEYINMEKIIIRYTRDAIIMLNNGLSKHIVKEFPFFGVKPKGAAYDELINLTLKIEKIRRIVDVNYVNPPLGKYINSKKLRDIPRETE